MPGTPVEPSGEEPEEEPPPLTADERQARMGVRAKEIAELWLRDSSVSPGEADLVLYEAEAEAARELFDGLIDDAALVFEQTCDARNTFQDPLRQQLAVDVFKDALEEWARGDYERCSEVLAGLGIEAMSTVKALLEERRSAGRAEGLETLEYCLLAARRRYGSAPD